MSYLDLPRLHFSGGFKASPSTINNAPDNYNPLVYPSPNELEKVELYWNPKGDGGFEFVHCTVTRVDYADGTFATDPAQDPIIGQPVTSVLNPSFPLASAMVDLDPMQQNTSEIYALRMQIGGDDANLSGSFANTAFNAIWGQCQGPDAPHSSASGSAVFQALLQPAELKGTAGTSKFLQYFEQHPFSALSVNFVTNAHNNAPPIYRFDSDTFRQMNEAGVPQSTLDKLAPMKNLIQNVGRNKGDVPTKDFVKYMMQQYLSLEEFNQCIDTVLKVTQTAYTGSTSEDFLYGLLTGTAGPAGAGEPTYFVPSRMMCPPDPSSPAGYFAPFSIDSNNVITLNLGNSLPTKTPGNDPYSDKLGTLTLVAFPAGETASPDRAQTLVTIGYNPEMLTQRAGFFSASLSGDWGQTPLGIKSTLASGEESILLAEDPQGYYLRADQFVFRMNPGIPATAAFLRGDRATVNIHVSQFGKPVADGTEVAMTMMTEEEAIRYTCGTPGTSGTRGIENLSIPQTALKMAGGASDGSGHYRATASTKDGVASFDLHCTDPGNPRKYVDGQVYFLRYNFSDPSISASLKQDVNDLVSVLVYNQQTDADAPEVLAKFGRLYKIMGFLTDEEKVEQIDLRNMIKLLLQRPFDQVQHMPVTRDMSEAARDKVVQWINTLNNS